MCVQLHMLLFSVTFYDLLSCLLAFFQSVILLCRNSFFVRLLSSFFVHFIITFTDNVQYIIVSVTMISISQIMLK